MANPIPLELPTRGARAELENRLQRASTEHGEALLAGYQVLQGLYDNGVLDLLRGALGSGDKVIPMIVDAANKPEPIRAMRNLLLLGKLACNVPPEILQSIAQTASDTLLAGRLREPLSLWQLAKKMCGKDTRRALTIMACVLEAIGKAAERPTESCSGENPS